MASIDDITADIVEDFEVFDNWMDKYEFIIDMSKSLAPMPAEKKQVINLIKGCQSQVWLDVQLDDKGLMQCHADADAIITKGMIALLLKPVQGQKPADVAACTYDFLTTIGLSQHLSPTRANGLLSMVKQIRMYGIAMQATSRP
jgi:cysteine desulfuration protein SufE